jgi:predicted sugar kinase
MSLDSSKIASSSNSVFTAGAISFSIGIFKEVTIKTNNTGLITITPETARPSLALHAAHIMKEALGFLEGLEISVKATHDIRHAGLGSSGSTLAGVAAAINEIFGKPLDNSVLARYITHNYGEEIDGDPDRLFAVQSMGTTALCGLIEGGLLVVSGDAVPIQTANLSNDLRVVIGIPNKYVPADAATMMQAEVENMQGFVDLGHRYSNEVAYRLVHSVLPNLHLNNLKPLKQLVFDHRWNFGSIKNCSFAYPPLVELGEALRDLENDSRVSIVGVSSVGPAFFALTNDEMYIQKRFEQLDMKVINVGIHNGTYEVL